MKRAIKICTLMTAVIMTFNLFGCGKDKRFDIKTYKNAEKNTMLLDYFERVVGTPEQQPYDEIVLYTYSDTQALLEKYTEGGSSDETVTRYLIPIDAAQEMLTAVRKSDMASWNSRSDTVGITGKLYVCKFPDGNGSYIRVSSEKMPEDGIAAFNKVRTAMSGWMKDGYLDNG